MGSSGAPHSIRGYSVPSLERLMLTPPNANPIRKATISNMVPIIFKFADSITPSHLLRCVLYKTPTTSQLLRPYVQAVLLLVGFAWLRGPCTKYHPPPPQAGDGTKYCSSLTELTQWIPTTKLSTCMRNSFSKSFHLLARKLSLVSTACYQSWD